MQNIMNRSTQPTQNVPTVIFTYGDNIPCYGLILNFWIVMLLLQYKYDFLRLRDVWKKYEVEVMCSKSREAARREGAL